MIDIVVPTIGRPSLATLLASLERARGSLPQRIILVDDRRDRSSPLELGERESALADCLTIIAGNARGPAAARNAGWRTSHADWIAFLDDDVVVDEDWLAALAHDLDRLPLDVAGSTGRVRVPLPTDRRPTDWERNVAGLERARWITADCAYRRSALLACDGFDDRFPRAYREDADIALRITSGGQRIVAGTRGITHPVRPAPWHISVRLQAGNADDVRMEALHGRDWRDRAGAPRGAFGTHVASVGAAAVALAGTCLWLALTAHFAWRRIAPGPRTPNEIGAMVATSVAIPFAAVYHHVNQRVREVRAARRYTSRRRSSQRS